MVVPGLSHSARVIKSDAELSPDDGRVSLNDTMKFGSCPLQCGPILTSVSPGDGEVQFI